MESGLTQEEQLQKAREERANIVARYDRGREEGAIIDAWEDPNYELYHKTDRYGFIHDTRLPDTRSKEEARRIEAEKSRSMKWAKMLSSWSKYEGTEKLYKRVHKGVPLMVRGSVWAKLLKLQKVKEQQKGKYEEMKKLGRKWSTDVRQIDLDVNRTYRDHEFFRLRYDIRQQQLFHVLVAYSMYNQEIGYCQGMSQLAALLLIYLNEEEDAFWALSALMSDPRFAMHGFFIPGFPKLLRYQAHHDRILSKFLPKLKRHLEKNGIESTLYILKWFFQCFLDRVPFSLALRLWDILLLEGERLMIAMAYTILKLHKRQIMKLDMDQILDYLQKRLELDFGYDDDFVVEYLEKTMEELRKNKLDYPGQPTEDELPQKPFGLFVEPTLEQEVGLRGTASQKEKLLTEELLQRQDQFALNGERLSVGRGSQTSIDKSVDEVSSFEGVGGSRISLATSLTSAPDFSTLSSSRRFDIDDASIRSTKSLMSAETRSVQSIRSPKSPTEYKFRSNSSSQSPIHKPTKNVNGTECPSGSAASNRPSQLSISQMTLQDTDPFVSEPSTPKASETPDTVRIFVPYTPPDDIPVNDATPVHSNDFGHFDLSNIAPMNGGPAETTFDGSPYKITLQIDGTASPVEPPVVLHKPQNPHTAIPYKPLDLDSPELQEGML